MIYFIYGHQLPVIKKTLKNLVKTCLNGIEQDDFNVQKLSARLVPIQDIVFDVLTYIDDNLLLSFLNCTFPPLA